MSSSYSTGFSSTLLPPTSCLPLFSPAGSMPFSFACPPNPASSSTSSSSAAATRARDHGNGHRRPPRGPPPRTEGRNSRPSAGGGGGGAAHGRGGGNARSTGSSRRPASAPGVSNGGLERLLMGRAQLGVDLASEKRDLSDEEQDEDLKDQEIREFGHTFLLPIGVVKTQEELDAVQSRTPSPTPPSNAEDHQPRHQRAAASPEVQDVDDMPDLDDDLEDADAEAEEEDEDL